MGKAELRECWLCVRRKLWGAGSELGWKCDLSGGLHL